MKIPSRTFRVASLAVLLFTICLASSCSRPPDDVVKEGVAASAQIEMTRKNPFAVTAQATLKDYKITNSYKQGETQIYEYEGTVVIKGGFGNPNPAGQEVTVAGKVGVQQVGNRWESRPLF